MKQVIFWITAGLWLAALAAPAQQTVPTVLPEKTVQLESAFAEAMKLFVLDDFGRAVPAFEKVLALDPENGGVNYALALALSKNGDFGRATPYAEKAFLKDGDNKFYTSLLAELYQKQRRFREAARLYELLLVRYPDHSEYAVEAASLYMEQDNYKEALKAYERVEKTLGVTEDISRQKQLIYEKSGRLDEAIREGERLIATDPTDLSYVLAHAEYLVMHNRDAQALPWLERALALRPGVAQAHLLRAETFRRKGDHGGFQQEIEKALTDPGLDDATRNRLLTSFVQHGPAVASRAEAEALIRQHPDQPHGYAALGQVLLQAGDRPGARTQYARAARLDAANPKAWERLLQLDSDLSQPDSLARHAEEALEFFPNEAFFWFASGSARLVQNRYDEAREALEEARRLALDRKPLQVLIEGRLGDTYQALKRPQDSDAAYEAALRLDPTDAYVLNNYSYFLALRNDKLDRALALSRQLTKKNPEVAAYLDTHAWVLYVAGQYTPARTLLERALQLRPDSPTYLEHYGDVLFKLGEAAAALTQWKRAAEHGGNRPELQQKISSGRL